MSPTALRYDLQLSHGTMSNLSYVNAGQHATFTFLVSNAHDTVTVKSIQFDFAPFGGNSSNLVVDPGALKPVPPDGWRVLPDEPVTFAPKHGVATVGTAPLVFRVDAEINAVSGVATIRVLENTDQLGPAERDDPFAVAKMASSFVLANLRATAPSVAPNERVTLLWDATPGQRYRVRDSSTGLSDDVTAPSGGTATWVSPPVRTSTQMITFTVYASRQEAGQTLTVEASTTVPVDAPQIVSFDAPDRPSFNRAVTLTWDTTNTDHCRLLMNGEVIDDHAPTTALNPGYDRVPALTHRETHFQLVAAKGNARVSSVEKTVMSYAWMIANTLVVEPPAGVHSQAIAVSPDGTRVAYGGFSGVTLIDAATMSVISSVFVDAPVARHGLGFSADGKSLFVSTARNELNRLELDGQWHRQTVSMPHGPIAIGRDGSRLYVGTANPAEQRQQHLSYVATGNLALIMGLTIAGNNGVTGIAVSRDNIVFVSVMMAGGDYNVLYFGNDQGTVWAGPTVSFSALALGPSGDRVYLIDAPPLGSAGSVGIRYATRDGQLHRVATLFEQPPGTSASLPIMACDPDGNVYAGHGVQLYFADLSMGAAGPVPTPYVIGASSGDDVGVNPVTGVVYYARGGTVFALRSNANRPVIVGDANPLRDAARSGSLSPNAPG